MSAPDIAGVVGGHFVGTLAADGHEPFTHSCTARDGQMAAEFICQVWLLGHPERRFAKNISVTFDEPAACTCVPGEGCDEEGEPGCAYCRSLDCEMPCPAERSESGDSDLAR